MVNQPTRRFSGCPRRWSPFITHRTEWWSDQHLGVIALIPELSPGNPMQGAAGSRTGQGVSWARVRVPRFPCAGVPWLSGALRPDRSVRYGTRIASVKPAPPAGGSPETQRRGPARWTCRRVNAKPRTCPTASTYRTAAARKLTASADRIVRRARTQPRAQRSGSFCPRALRLQSFEEHHKRVGGDTDSDDEPGDAGQVEGEADVAAQEHQHRVDHQTGQAQ